jgi:hypothetical protein
MKLSTYLYVPSADGEAAQALGAQWDPRTRKWYVPEGMDAEPFKAWLPLWEDGSYLHINGPLFVAEAKTTCRSCGERTPVVALATERLDEAGEPYICTLFQIEEIPSDLSLLIATHYPYFKKEEDGLMNHCRCGEPLTDWDLHEEPGGSFSPITPEAAMTILLRRIPRSDGLSLIAAYSVPTDDLLGSYAIRQSF